MLQFRMQTMFGMAAPGRPALPTGALPPSSTSPPGTASTTTTNATPAGAPAQQPQPQNECTQEQAPAAHGIVAGGVPPTPFPWMLPGSFAPMGHAPHPAVPYAYPHPALPYAYPYPGLPYGYLPPYGYPASAMPHLGEFASGASHMSQTSPSP